MTRRTLLRYLGGLAAGMCLPLKALAAKPKSELVHPVFGPYLGHRCWNSPEEVGDEKWFLFPGDEHLVRRVYFPVECRLIVDFEGFELGYLAFNVSAVMVDRINGYGAYRLVSMLPRDWDDGLESASLWFGSLVGREDDAEFRLEYVRYHGSVAGKVLHA